jgi:sugar O-acyltransferase (sialic acid O-acetyltransferase NeuD family)
MKVIVIGSSGHAKVIIDAINKGRHYEAVGLIDDFRPIGETTLGIPVIGKVDDIEVHKELNCSWIIGIGDNKQRHRIYSKLMELKLNYINVIHPSAIIGNDVDYGVGNFIAAGSIINSGTRIGNHCIINTGAQLDHDNVIGDFVSIAPKAALAGNVTVEMGSYIGMGANVIEKITISRQTVIGAGSLVNRNIARFKVAFGVPCIEQRERTDKEIFL